MLSLSDIQEIYQKIKDDIARAYKKQDLDRVVALIDSYASVSQRINDIFCDDEIEEYIENIAEEYVGIIETPNQKWFAGEKKIIFYDQIGTTVCLGVQYLRGLIKNGYKILYIYEDPYTPINNNLLKLLEKENNIEVFLLDSTNNKIKKAQELRDQIISFNANKLIIHSPAYGAFGAVVLSTIPFIRRFRIVPGDHHFYIGCKCIDFFLEFRDFGVRLAVEKRGILLSKLYKLPYYPLIGAGGKFQGFPKETEGKIIIVVAGAEYKFHGSNLYFEVCIHILNKYSNVVMLFIGSVSEKIHKFIAENELEGRFIPLGYRNDFGECINHADILFNSYPFSGGLICQYAAYYSLPILSISDQKNSLVRSVRGALGAEDNGEPISFFDMDRFYDYVQLLLTDQNFRKKEGKRMKSMLQTERTFNASLESILAHDFLNPRMTELPIDYDYRTRIYLENQNLFKIDIINPLLRVYGIRLLFIFPFLFSVLMKQKKYVINRIAALYGKRAYSYLPSVLKDVFKK